VQVLLRNGHGFDFENSLAVAKHICLHSKMLLVIFVRRCAFDTALRPECG
jgi:hypothetical protein